MSMRQYPVLTGWWSMWVGVGMSVIACQPTNPNTQLGPDEAERETSQAALATPTVAHDARLLRIMDRELEPQARVKALQQASQELEADPTLIALLYQVLLAWGHPIELRLAALETLVELDEAEFRRTIARRIVQIEQQQVLDRLYEIAVQRQWRDFTTAAIRAYALPSQVSDEQRAERAVIANLNPQEDVISVVVRTFRTQADEVTPEVRLSAWVLLGRLLQREQWVEMLMQSPDHASMIQDLQIAQRELGMLADTRQAVLWLSSWRDPALKTEWARLRDIVQGMTDQQRAGLQMRHLALLLAVHQGHSDWLRLDRPTLLTRLQQALSNAQTFNAALAYDGQLPKVSQQLTDHADRLCFADLLTVKLMLHVLSNPLIIWQAFTQADADLKDTTTEYGGVMVLHDSTRAQLQHIYALVPYPPDLRTSDFKYVSPPALILHLHTALAHYHFHAQTHHNVDYAGPGSGDLRLADHQQLHGLVFTFISSSLLNVDYYQPDQIIIDLGCIERPQ